MVHSEMVKRKPTKVHDHHKRLKIIVLLTFVALFVGSLALVYFVTHYFNYKTVAQKPAELPGISLYSVQETDATPAYTLYSNYPQIGEPAFDQAVRALADKSRQSFLLSMRDRPATVHDLNISHAINYYNDRFLSVDLIIHRAGDGKVTSREHTIIYNRLEHKVITIEDLFKGSDYLTVLSGQARARLPTVLGDQYDPAQAHAGTEPKAINFSAFTVDKYFNVVLVFEKGQVASAEIGVVHLPVPAQSLASELNYPYVQDVLKIAADKLPNYRTPRSKAIVGPAPQADPTGVDCASAKCLALTFDDGPTPLTEELLDVLKQHNAKATFFDLGLQVQKYPSIVRRTIAEGHVVGNHTFDHKNLLALPVDQVKGQMTRTADSIQAASGLRPGIARAPYGAVTAELAKAIGVPFIGWNIDPSDWRDRDPAVIYDHILAYAKPGGIILSHDIYQPTIEAYKRAIPELQRQGYTLVTVPQLLGFSGDVTPDVYFGR